MPPPLRLAVPLTLTTFRLLLAPAIVVLAHAGVTGPLFAVLMVAAFLSDLFDGILARRLGVVTAALRRYDVVADVVFYLAVLWGVIVMQPEVAAAYAVPFGGILVLEGVCQGISLARFRQTTATHAWLCKAWAVLLCVASAALLGFGVAGPLLVATVAMGYVAYADVLLILVLSPVPPVDTPSAYHVWRSLRRAAADRAPSAGP
jgi:CDP-diacylglycerol--glycerol-3-phosphate 3-phosphatidyltransferase